MITKAYSLRYIYHSCLMVWYWPTQPITPTLQILQFISLNPNSLPQTCTQGAHVDILLENTIILWHRGSPKALCYNIGLPKFVPGQAVLKNVCLSATIVCKMYLLCGQHVAFCTDFHPFIFKDNLHLYVGNQISKWLPHVFVTQWAQFLNLKRNQFNSPRPLPHVWSTSEHTEM